MVKKKVQIHNMWVSSQDITKLYFFVFLHSSVGKESTCNSGDLSLIPGSGRSNGEGIGYPFQYSWVFLVAQLIKNLPAMQETSVQSLSWEDPLEKEKATHCSVLAWRIPRTVVHGVTKSQTWLSDFHFTCVPCWSKEKHEKEKWDRRLKTSCTVSFCWDCILSLQNSHILVLLTLKISYYLHFRNNYDKYMVV